MSADPSNPPPVQPKAAYPPLEAVFRSVDELVRVSLNNAGDDIIQNIVLPEMQAPAIEASVVPDVWLPDIEAMLDANIGIIIDEVWKELPQMVSDAIDSAIGDSGRTVLPQLARNEYTCALPCNCEPGCPGVSPDCQDEEEQADEFY